MDRLFLDEDEMRHLTGCTHRARQVAQLRIMGIPFWINAKGVPVVACSAIQGSTSAKATPPRPEPQLQP